MSNIQEEIWKDVVGYEGLYLVSNQGRIQRKAPGLRMGRSYPGKIIKNSYDTWGYSKVLLHKNGKSSTKRIHRLVAIAFHENPLDKPTVNHKDRMKSNNRADNLEWATHKENVQHAFSTQMPDLPRSNGSIRRSAKINCKEFRSSPRSEA